MVVPLDGENNKIGILSINIGIVQLISINFNILNPVLVDFYTIKQGKKK